jgi:hypothetical protein
MTLSRVNHLDWVEHTAKKIAKHHCFDSRRSTCSYAVSTVRRNVADSSVGLSVTCFEGQQGIRKGVYIF